MTQIIKQIFFVYFTSFPSAIYNSATNSGNKCVAGIGLRLIENQRTFWFANTSTVSILLLNSMENTFSYYLLLFCIVLTVFLYFVSIYKTIYLLKLLQNVN